MAVQLINTTTALTGGGSTNQTPVGYCHDLALVVHADGSITPNRVIFGNQGDLNITRLTFDITELTNVLTGDLNTDYTLQWIVYNNTTHMVHKYILTDTEWVVSEELTNAADSYSCLFECIENETAGTHTIAAEKEVWVSRAIAGVVQSTAWTPAYAAALATPIVNTDTEGYLVKPPSTLTFSTDHYTVALDDTYLGEKYDQLVKRFILEDTSLDEGFVQKYGIFVQNDTIFCVQAYNINSNTVGFILPRNIFWSASPVTFTLVATTENVVDNPDVAHDGYKRWVSNVLTLTIGDNFLSESPLSLEQVVVTMVSGLTCKFSAIEHASEYKVYVDENLIGTTTSTTLSLPSLAGWNELPNGNRNITIAATAPGYIDGANCVPFTVSKPCEINVESQHGTVQYEETSIAEGETVSVLIESNFGYHLPETISVTNATYEYNNASGVITLTHPIGDIQIHADCLPNIYSITYHITSGTVEGSDSVTYGTSITGTLIPNTKYVLPESITVTNATFTYDAATGELVISNPTNNVVVTAICMRVYDVTTNLDHGSGTPNLTLLTGKTAVAYIYADYGYTIPTSIGVTGATYTYTPDDIMGTIYLSQPVDDIVITGVCEPTSLHAPRISITNNTLSIIDSDTQTTHYTIYEGETVLGTVTRTT